MVAHPCFSWALVIQCKDFFLIPEECKCLTAALDTCRSQCERLREGKLARMLPGFANCFIWFLNFLSSMGSQHAHGSSRYARTISRHADGISWYSIQASAGPLLPLCITVFHNNLYLYISHGKILINYNGE